jgi:hypothetical protein
MGAGAVGAIVKKRFVIARSEATVRDFTFSQREFCIIVSLRKQRAHGMPAGFSLAVHSKVHSK